MDYMFQEGFFGIGAPFFMDVVIVIVALLPFLVFGGIWLASQGKYSTHKFAQIFIFLVSVVVIGYFEYGVRIGGGFELSAQKSNLPYWFLLSFLIIHIAIAVVTVVYWVRVLNFAFNSNYHFRPTGFRVTKHAKMGQKLSRYIVLTSITGIMVYLL